MAASTNINALLKKFDQPVPRYTSYPTAPHFHDGIDAEKYRQWLEALPEDRTLSLYAHIPFCDTLCWFCGCNTKITQKYEPVSSFLEVLLKEIDLVADVLGKGRPKSHKVSHIHWGGGSPTILTPVDIKRLGDAFTSNFTLTPDAEVAVEIDPREVGEELVAALAEAGFNRASLGLQDVNLKVQEAINRVQPMSVNRHMVEMLRAEGITALNLDLMYGLPYQTEDHIRTSVSEALSLGPSRIALFGYAHVPWMKTHMKMIKEETLPGPDARFAQAEIAAEELVKAGFIRIGLDHFAHPDDSMAKALAADSLHRNFQGYTVDDAAALIGFGASAIGSLPSGYVQNHTAVHDYRRDVEAGKLPIAKGVALDADDRLRRDVISELMCHMKVDLDDLTARHGFTTDYFTSELEKMTEFEEAGLLTRDGDTLTLSETGRIFMRPVAATFDSYLAKTKGQGAGKHSGAV
jgi:oxygen-independent coproporphyrinogen-3 oxidase